MIKFKEFKLSKILEWQSQKEFGPLEIPTLRVESDKKYPFYGQSTQNNGIISYLSLDESFLNNKESKPTILIHSNNQNIVYVETPFYLKDGHGATSVLQSEHLNRNVALYIITSIKKIISKKFEYNEKATKIALKNTFINLPINENGEVDYDYMEDYIQRLESKKQNILNDCFEKMNLKDKVLTDEEEKALEKFRANKVIFRSFLIGYGDKCLFELNTTKKKFNANSVKFNGSYPYVARGSTNNGIRGYINEDIKYLNEAKTISFGQDTATMFFQEKPYFTGDKIKILSYKERELNRELACYLISSMRKAFQKFSWGESSFKEDILKKVEIQMPVLNDGSIDYDFITNFIRAIEKKLIKDIIVS